jgi:malate dehydrogenase
VPGVDKVFDVGTLSDYEKDGLKAMMPELLASIEKGLQFVKGA